MPRRSQSAAAEPAPGAARLAVTIEGGDTARGDRARLVAERSGARLVDAGGAVPDDVDVVIAATDERLEARLRDPDRPRTPFAGPVFVDFTAIETRTGTGNLSRKQPLPKAIGDANRTVADASGGLGHDAMLLALMGWRVVVMERSPVVFALLEDALERACLDEDFGALLGAPDHVRWRLVFGDAAQVLPGLDPAPDVVYFDPMYPERRKSSAARRKPIRLLRALVGDDDDAPRTFEIARGVARNRVVVKRPREAPSLTDRPDAVRDCKLVRYDVHLRPPPGA